MHGDYTKVPLRDGERWTGARMQQGRVLLDHEWNLNLDAGADGLRGLARDALGRAGVVAGSDAFEVAFTASDLTLGAGTLWADGLAALAGSSFTYASQDRIPPLPATGAAFVYLDVFEEHVQPAEDPSLVDPALAPVDSAARTRVGYRVRVAATTASSCQEAMAALGLVGGSSGRVSIARASTAVAPDPCAPPGDPLGAVPDGLFRVEVLDGGTQATARFGWSFENGAVAIAVVAVAGDTVTLAPSQLRFAVGDRVEVSYLARRADRLGSGGLYTVASVTPGPGGDVLKLDRAVSQPTGALGLVVRRWDGESVGVATVNALWRGADIGVRFKPGAGAYVAGDWWGARLRAEAGDGIEARSGAAPDGTLHVFVPLALVDLGARTVVGDCRPQFTPLSDLGGACTVTVRPGDDLQAAVERLPAGGGELCFSAGTYLIAAPLHISGRQRVVLNGAGPASVLRAVKREAAVFFEKCSDVEVHGLRVEGGSPGSAPGDPDLEGALTFVGCSDVVVADCALACPDSDGRAQTCVTVRGGSGGIRIERNLVEVGAWQAGILVVDPGRVSVTANQVVLAAVSGTVGLNPAVGAHVRALVDESLRTRAGAGATDIELPGAERPLHVAGDEAALFAADFAASAKPSAIKKSGGQKALLAFARGLGTGAGVDALSPASRVLLDRLAVTLRSVGQGIVVGGSHATTVSITDNVVDGALQGIHVGVSDSAGGTQSVDSVMLARNVVRALVPASYDRDRHGIFIGNARSVHISDTVATLRRTGGTTPVTPVEGIRIHGVLGPFLSVRQTSLDGFAVGVRVVPLAPQPSPRMWLVAELFAAGAAPSLDAPPQLVDRERIAP